MSFVGQLLGPWDTSRHFHCVTSINAYHGPNYSTMSPDVTEELCSFRS